MSLNELKKVIDDHLEPIDFDDLIEGGFLEKRRGWYKVFDIKKLPEHVQVKIKSMKTTSKGEILVQFRSPSKRLQKTRQSLE